MPDRRSFLRSLLGLAAAPLGLRTPAQADTAVRYPYLQNVGPDGASVLWATFEDGQGQVRYSTDRSYTRSASGTAREMTPEETGFPSVQFQHRVRLPGLQPGSSYFYRVFTGSDLLADGDGLRFRTAASGPFSFLAFGDSGTGGAPQRQLARLMLEESVSLVVHTGDIAYLFGTFTQFQDHHFAIYADLMARVPFFPCPGNHEYWTPNAGPYLALHEVPTAGVPERDRGRYYSFDWGSVHFVSLDSNSPLYESATGRGLMLQWLEEDLRRTRQFWKIVYFHHPPYAWGHNDRDTQSALAREHVVPILERHGVQLVLTGHEHSYQRCHPIRQGQQVEPGRGILYVTTGGGGGPLYSVNPNPLLAQGASRYHYVRLTVEGFRLNAVAVDLNGDELDRWTLAPAPELPREGVVNAASFLPQLAPGAFVSLFGQNLALDQQAAQTLPLPLSLGDVQVRAGGRQIPLLFVSPGQINAHLPFDLAGTTEISVITPNGTAQARVTLADTAPGILAVTHPSGALVTADAPARPGGFLVVYATGLGTVTGTIQAGYPAPSEPLLHVTHTVRVDFGGISVLPPFSGLAPGFAGLYQVNFQVPEQLPAGDHALTVRSAGNFSNTVFLPVRL